MNTSHSLTPLVPLDWHLSDTAFFRHQPSRSSDVRPGAGVTCQHFWFLYHWLFICSFPNICFMVTHPSKTIKPQKKSYPSPSTCDATWCHGMKDVGSWAESDKSVWMVSNAIKWWNKPTLLLQQLLNMCALFYIFGKVIPTMNSGRLPVQREFSLSEFSCGLTWD